MVEPRNPFMGPRRSLTQRPGAADNTSKTEGARPAAPPPRQMYNGRPRLSGRRAQPVTPQEQKAPEIPPVPETSKPVKNDSLLEAFIKLINSVIKFRGK